MKSEKNVNSEHLLPYILLTFIIFIAFCCSIFIFDIDVNKIPFKQLLMKVVFVEGHALSKQAVFYTGVGTSNAQRYLALEDETRLTQGTTITHESGSYPNGLAVLVRDTTFDAGSTYVLTFNYTIKTRYQYKLPTNFMSIGTWSNPNDNVGTAQAIINTSTALTGTTDCRGISSCYETNITFTGQWYQQNNGTAIIGFSQFDAANRVTWFKLNSFTTTKTSGSNADIINNNNQNTNLIINNNNQNTQEIVDAQNGTTDAVNDLNDTISSTNIGSSHGSSIINQIQFFNDNTLSSVITAPINWVNSITNACSPVTFTIFNQPITLPCGDTLFWNRNDVSTFRVFWNAFFGGLIIYRLLYKLFKTITDALDPTKNELGGITL